MTEYWQQETRAQDSPAYNSTARNKTFSIVNGAIMGYAWWIVEVRSELDYTRCWSDNEAGPKLVTPASL